MLERHRPPPRRIGSLSTRRFLHRNGNPKWDVFLLSLSSPYSISADLTVLNAVRQTISNLQQGNTYSLVLSSGSFITTLSRNHPDPGPVESCPTRTFSRAFSATASIRNSSTYAAKKTREKEKRPWLHHCMVQHYHNLSCLSSSSCFSWILCHVFYITAKKFRSFRKTCASFSPIWKWIEVVLAWSRTSCESDFSTITHV